MSRNNLRTITPYKPMDLGVNQTHFLSLIASRQLPTLPEPARTQPRKNPCLLICVTRPWLNKVLMLSGWSKAAPRLTLATSPAPARRAGAQAKQATLEITLFHMHQDL